MTKRKYVDVKYCNTTQGVMPFNSTKSFRSNILDEDIGSWTVSIIRAEIPLSNLPIMVLDSSKVVCGSSTVNLQGDWYNVFTFLNKLNDKIGNTFGKFEIDYDKRRLKFTRSSGATVSMLSFEHSEMKELFRGFSCFSYDKNDITYIATAGSEFSQILSTLDRFYKYKSISISSNLPTIPEICVTNVEDEPHNYLTDILLTPPSDHTSFRDSVYLVSSGENRRISLLGGNRITDLNISVAVYYANNKRKLLQVNPGDYVNVKLCFEKI